MAKATAQGIAAHVTVIDGKPTTTTHDIAAVYGKDHAKVLRIVRQRMAEAGAWGVANFGETPYTNEQNGQTYTVIRMTQKGFHFVVGKFTGAKAVQHQIAFADEFERMAEQLASVGLGRADSVDPRGLMLSGQQALQAPLPAEVATALDAKAWDMAREAFGIARTHLERKVSYYAQVGVTPHINPRLALAAITATTLGQALTHTHQTALRQTLQSMQMTARIHQDALDRAAKALACGETFGA